MLFRRQILFFILWPIPVLVPCVEAATADPSLILVEFGEDSLGTQTQTLVRYRFRHGAMVSRESIVTTNTLDLRYDLGRNLIHERRYVITAWGDVVDLRSKKVLLKSKGELLGVDATSNSVIIKVDREGDDGIYAFDLISRRYRPLHQPGRWAMPGTVSPNGRLSAVGEGAKIWLHYPSGEEVLLGSEFSREGTAFCSSFAVPTFIWLDDRRLLTQRGNGHLVIVDIEGRIEPLTTIPAVTPPPCGPEIRRDRSNQIYYEAAQGAWGIDTVKRSASPYLWKAAGDDFDIEYRQDPSYGSVVHYRGKDIGRWWCGDWATAPGHIAVVFGPVGSNLGNPKGVKVWSAGRGIWTTIEPKWLAALIGWTTE